MKFNFKLRRLCGAYYGNPSSTQQGTVGADGANVIYTSDGNTLLSPVSNRIQVVDLQSQTVRTLSVESRSNIRSICLSPDDTLLLVVDVQNHAMLVNFRRGIVLHRFRFKRKVRHALFSPDGNYFAVTHGKHVQVWCTPNHLRREFAPLVLHRTYTGQSDDVRWLDWTQDSSVLLAGSRDCTVRIWTVHTTRDFEPVTLSGHKGSIVGAYFQHRKCDNSLEGCYSISEDGTLVTWKMLAQQTEDIDPPPPPPAEDENDDGLENMMEEAADFFMGGASSKKPEQLSLARRSNARKLVRATWSVQGRHYFQQDKAVVTSTSYCEASDLLVVGFSTGLFGLYEMPSVSNIHTLSIGSNQIIKTCVLNASGDWLALGCPTSQQLLVWEWRSETYVLKQRGHAYGMRCMAYSPDGVVICTGGEDGKLKLWNATSGFCYVTMEKSHTAPVTAVCFANSSVVLSASLDGTVRAHDLHRYRTFRTLTTPIPGQFLSLSVDPSGELVTAGSAEPFEVYVWNLQTGKLLDILTGHTGPVCQLTFQANGGVLVSASWDGTVKLWELYKGNVPSESLQHSTDVVCVASRPDGKEICSGTIGGRLTFWDVEKAKLKFEIDGRRDIAGGRKLNDRRSADNNAASRYFTSICYSADGSCILAGGNSKYVCIYEVSQQMLLKKFQITCNRNLDGVLDEVSAIGSSGLCNKVFRYDDELPINIRSKLLTVFAPGASNFLGCLSVTTEIHFRNCTCSTHGLTLRFLYSQLNSKNLGAGGPIDDHAGSEDETTYNAIQLPGAKRGDDGSRNSRVEVLTMQVAFSSTGREWSTVSGEGLHVFSLDEDMIFDPISLTEAVTPGAVNTKLHAGDYGTALRMAVHLNEFSLVKQVLEETPYASIPHVARAIGADQIERLLQLVSVVMADSCHIEFYLQWCLHLLQIHGLHMEKHRTEFMRAFRAMHKSVETRYEELKTICDDNKYTLDFVENQSRLMLRSQEE